MIIEERAAPKVNLTLRVAGKRTDGFHELESLVAFATDLFDVVTLERGPACGVTTCGPFAAGIAGENLLAVTLAAVARAAPGAMLGAVTLEKNLPIAAGIGGGSADAAALLRAVRTANRAQAEAIDWNKIAAGLGADVPVCLASRAQLMTGIGEILTPVVGLPSLWAVLVNPLVPVPPDKTAQVFHRLAAPPLSEASPKPPEPPRFADRTDLLSHMRSTGNGLLAPARAIVPAIDEVIGVLMRQPACELAQLSGGGPTCFGVFADWAHALAAANAIAAAKPDWWVRASRLS